MDKFVEITVELAKELDIFSKLPKLAREGLAINAVTSRQTVLVSKKLTPNH